MKKIVSKNIMLTGFVSLFMMVSTSMIYANERDAVLIDHNDCRYLGTQVSHSWSFEQLNTTSETYGSWKFIYEGEPAKKTGEHDTVSHSTTYNHTFSGTIGGGLKNNIEASLGYTFGKSVQFSASKNSAQLAKDEYIKAYAINNYEVTKLKLTDIIHTRGWELGYGGQYHPVNRYETKTSYVDAKRAIQPKIRIDYYKASKLVKDNNENTPYKTEYYECMNDEYVEVYIEE